MKQWKLVLVALLAVLLVCACTSALADECTHANATYVNGVQEWEKTSTTHTFKQWKDAYCPECKEVVEEKATYTAQEPASHILTQVSVTSATCTAAGTYYDNCAICGWKSNTFTTGKLDHDWNITPVAATCTAKGYSLYVCNDCGETHKWDETEKAAHNWDITPVAATCTKDSYNLYVCKVCGESHEFDSGLAGKGGHHWTSKQVESTCTVAGSYTTYCSVCDFVNPDASVTYPLALKSHNWQGTTVASTCTVAGSYTTACADCGFVNPDASVTYPLALADHNFQLVAAKTAYCGEDGYEAYYKCSACGALRNAGGVDITKVTVVEAPATAHDWYAHEKVEATCIAEGSVKYKCHNCTKTDTVKTEKVAHEYDPNGWWVIKNPTCFETGLETNSCIICRGAEQSRVVPTEGHVFASGSDLKYNAAGADAANKANVTKAATCTEAGTATVTCKVCEKTTKNITVPAHGHIWSKWTTVGEVSCTTDFGRTRSCSSCGDVENEVLIEKLGHDWVVTSGTDATCTEAGKVNRTCRLCNETQTNQKVDAKGHDYVWYTTAPTAAADGVKEYKCSVCGDVAKTEVIRYTVMRYSNTATAFGPSTRELVGGSEWARVTPIDLSVEGTFSYPLVASNQYVIGTVTVVIANGTFTVTYDVAASQIKVTAEDLLVYADKAALAAGTAQEYAFGAPIQIGEDAKVIISVLLTVDYDAVGAGVSGFDADAAQIAAMTGIID